MSARAFVAFGLFVAASTAHAEAPFDHAKARFPLVGKHQKVACESCHPASGGTRKWAGVPLDCHGCHGDRRNHKGALGAQCQLCHDVDGWKSIKHQAAQHRFALVGKHDLPCASCHAGGKALTPTATCADCHARRHGGTRSPCETCHVVEKWKTVAYRKHTYDPELLPGKHRAASCLACHPAFQFKGTSTQCESCHKNQPHEDLGACKQCHSPLSWSSVTPTRKPTEPPRASSAVAPSVSPTATPSSAPGLFRVKSKFDHVTHERRVAARGVKPNCASCHAGLDFAKRPAMQACEGCHDGKSAFDALGTQCDRCHQAPPGVPLAALSPSPKTFRHASHAKLDVKIDDCTSCHGVGIVWEKLHSGRDQHRPCQGCHAAEFRTAGQPICLGCHERNDPFRPNPLRLPTDARTEWRSPDALDLPHAPHIAAGLACEACHPKQSGMGRAPALGHTACARCHLESGPKAGAPLTLDHCPACHVLSSVPRQGGAKRPWSTRDHFRHDKDHRACVACHLPNGAPDLTPPTMQYCATCHDGLKAFQTIAPRGCIRCHDH